MEAVWPYLTIIYAGFWIGVFLGLLTITEIKHWFFKIFNVNVSVLYGLIPFTLLFDGLLLTTILLYLLGMVIGTNHTASYVTGRSIKKPKELLQKGVIKTSPFIVSSIIVIVLSSFL